MAESDPLQAPPAPLEVARLVRDGFRGYEERFLRVTRAARARFEMRDWQGAQADAQRRLALYDRAVRDTLGRVRDLAGDAATDPGYWPPVKAAFTDLVGCQRDPELAETFYNSITRKLFPEKTIDPTFEFVTLDTPLERAIVDPTLYRRFEDTTDAESCMRQVVAAAGFEASWEDLERDVDAMARQLERYLAGRIDPRPIDAIEVLRPIFYRQQSAFIVGRLVIDSEYVPLVLALRNEPAGIAVDALLTSRDDVSIVFSFARSYFLVDAESPGEVIVFLKSIMPRKPVAELFISIGANKHGKTELYRDLQRHVDKRSGMFRVAPGAAGMVMLVFVLDGFDMVFKVIRDTFPYPKQTTRRQVMERYRLVFKHDRVGRLIDAQQFEHLRFPRELFETGLLEELLDQAARTVRLEDDEVVFAHLYAERRIEPLDLYLREVDDEDALRATIDYGYAIKELAAANIFPGDFLLKNFGVTRHGRVVFYDYDELCLLTDCKFRRMPTARHLDDEMAAEPWFSVGPDDVFPEEFRKFLGLSAAQTEAFLDYHEDIFAVAFWKGLQERLAAGELPAVSPYPSSRRLGHDGGPAAPWNVRGS